ncbi:MAG TPA: hypothetical protein VFN30_06915 [Chitinophagaceae bacterium]|nr:hypothetical protein [Chitinophagaceae bacterium]
MLHPHLPVAEVTDGFLYHELLSFLNKSAAGFPVIYPVITYILLFTQSLTLNRLINEQRLMYTPNYLVAMAYLLVTSLIPNWNYLSSVLIANSVMVWAWPRMVSLYKNPNPKTLLFNIGMGFGIASFFYVPSLLLLVLLVIALLVFRPFKITEWIVALLGILTPYYFLFVYLFLTDKLNFATILPEVSFNYPDFKLKWFWARTSLLVFPLLVGMYFVQANTNRMLIQVRKSWALMRFYFLISLFIPLFNSTSAFDYWILSAIPLACFHGAAYFYPRQSIFPGFLHWLTILFIILSFFL